jgi:hypothetical protein
MLAPTRYDRLPVRHIGSHRSDERSRW